MHALIPDALLTELNALQQRILREGLPVLVVFEGSSGRVIGRVNSELIRCLEPRGVLYVHFDPAADASRPILDFLHKTPGRGQIGLFDRSWYSMIIEKFNEDEKKKEFKSMLDVSNDLERYLVLNGVFLIKIILKATESAIEKYGKEYGPRIPKKSFLSMDHIDPAKYREVMFDQVYEKTDTEYAPWNKILVKGINETVIETVEKIIGMVNSRLDAGPRPYDPPKIDRIYPNPRKNMERKRSVPTMTKR